MKGLFARDDTVVDEEIEHEEDIYCACTRHPSGERRQPRPSCMNCRGTGKNPREVAKGYFDGSGTFITGNGAGQSSPPQLTPKVQGGIPEDSNGPDTVPLVSFR